MAPSGRTTRSVPSGTFASGASKRTIPRFVLVRTASRVARIADEFEPQLVVLAVVAGRDLVGEVMRRRRSAIGQMVRATPVADPAGPGLPRHAPSA